MRNAARTRIRIQLEPFPFAWPGWEHRTGDVAESDYRLLCASTDVVEIERLHQDMWRQMSPEEP